MKKNRKTPLMGQYDGLRLQQLYYNSPTQFFLKMSNNKNKQNMALYHDPCLHLLTFHNQYQRQSTVNSSLPDLSIVSSAICEGPFLPPLKREETSSMTELSWLIFLFSISRVFCFQ